MAIKGYVRKTRTGGDISAMDGINGTLLNDGDFCFVGEVGAAGAPGELSVFFLEATNGSTADGVNIVAPTVNAGLKRWVARKIYMDTTEAATILAQCLAAQSSAEAAQAAAESIGISWSLSNSELTLTTA